MAKTARRRARTAGLPEWDLDDLYQGRDDPEIERNLVAAAKRAKAFAGRHGGKLAGLDGDRLGRAIAAYERLAERLDRIASYAQLLFAADSANPENARFHQTINERITEITSELLFFELEINRLGDRVLKKQLSAKRARKYAPWIRDTRVFRPHQLSIDLEKMLLEKSVAGRQAWIRLFDETMNGLRFRLGGKALTESEILNRLSDHRPEVRKRAAKAFADEMFGNERLFALITNTLAKDKEIDDRWRRYAHPAARRNLANQVEDHVVEALVSSVKESYGDLAHRYYRLKARWMGRRRLPYWDRNAPLPEAGERPIPWPEAKRMVLDAYGGFAPELGRLAKRFFDNSWIDAAPRPGKSSGAFSHPTVPSVHPYILMNYHGRARDVMTLAHELGHGVHQLLAAPKGHFLSDTPLTLAETASVFGEMLTFRALLDKEKNARRRKLLLASKVEDMLNTVVRQTAFFDFERRVHTERAGGELSAERLGDIWMEVQSESLGPAFRLAKDYRIYWAYIPHFIHSPFYVYAYAFGDCLVNSLYDVYLEGVSGFREKYLAMLRAGGTLRHGPLLAPFGLDAGDRAFWRRGLGVISRFIDELEEG